MKTAKKVTGTVLATAAAALFLSGCATSESKPASSGSSASAAQVKCVGVNACKGRSSCKTSASACKGQNACKAQGFVLMDSSTCGHVGGKVG
jgi:hypothetical protein